MNRDGKTTYLCRLNRALAACICNKYQNLMNWLIFIVITCTVEASSIKSKAGITCAGKTPRRIPTLTISADTWYLCTLVDICKHRNDKTWVICTRETPRDIPTLTISADTWYLCTLVDICNHRKVIKTWVTNA